MNLPDDPKNDFSTRVYLETLGEWTRDESDAKTGFHYAILRRTEFPTPYEAEQQAKRAVADQLGLDPKELDARSDEAVKAGVTEEESLPFLGLGEGSDAPPETAPESIKIPRPEPKIIYWICVGILGKPDPEIQKFSKTLLDKVLHRLHRVVSVDFKIPVVPGFHAYVATSTDNPLDREKGVAKMIPHVREKLLRDRAERLAGFLADAWEFEKSFGAVPGSTK